MTPAQRSWQNTVDHFAYKHGAACAEHHVQLGDGDVSRWIEMQGDTVVYDLLDQATDAEHALMQQSLAATNSSGTIQQVLRMIARRLAVADILAKVPAAVGEIELARAERLSA